MTVHRLKPAPKRPIGWNSHKIEILKIGISIGWPHAAVAVLVNRPIGEVRDVAWSLKQRRAG